ncbi:MAG: APC family permease [Actinobacteria bacterium]|nr:APC family permease [Actinomycetota bacterium]
MIPTLKRILVGAPLSTAQAAHERLTNFKALAVLSSDALSSVAYATEEILLVMVLAGSTGLAWSLPIAGFITVVLTILIFSYRQTIHAYPSGGGAYTVAKDNLGVYSGLTAGAALLIDYVMTVSVSVASGVAALTSAFPVLYEHRVILGLAAIAIVTLANLRGVRESGTIFAAPTYLFIGSLALLTMTGIVRYAFLGAGPAAAPPPQPVQALTLLLILRAFASGCSALTGVEAISNGVQVFRAPEARNAARTLLYMGVTLLSLFLGVSVLAHFYGVVPKEGETVVSQIARQVFGDGPLYYLVQATTTLILILAANTSFADFPRLASLIARDGFLPNQLAYRGDRLVFSNGIVFLGAISSLLIVIFRGDTHALIPLYAVGVFLSFTLSQTGMVVHWYKLRTPGWQRSAFINGLGAVTTAIALAIIGATKFIHGAWLVIVLIPVLVYFFHIVHGHYSQFKKEMALAQGPAGLTCHTVIVPVAGINRSVAASLNYARSISSDVRAVHVALDPEKGQRLRAEWDRLKTGVPLTVIDSPYRSVVNPLVSYIEQFMEPDPNCVVTVVVPEFVPPRWWHNLLHNQTSLYLKAALHFHKGVIITSVPYHLAS